MEGRIVDTNALMLRVYRIVNMASYAGILAFQRMSSDLKLQFKNPNLSLKELDRFMSSYVK